MWTTLETWAAGPVTPMPNFFSRRARMASRRWITLEPLRHKGFASGLIDAPEFERASAIISRHSRAMLQVSDHQAISAGSSEWPSGVYMCPPSKPNPAHAPVRLAGPCGSISVMLQSRPCGWTRRAGKNSSKAAAIATQSRLTLQHGQPLSAHNVYYVITKLPRTPDQPPRPVHALNRRKARNPAAHRS